MSRMQYHSQALALIPPRSLSCLAKAILVLATATGALVVVPHAEAQTPFQSGYPQAPNTFPSGRVPTSAWAVAPPSTPDPTPQGEIVDHTSMSPDSWSAPIPLPPNNGFPNARFPDATFRQQASNRMPQNNSFAPPTIQTRVDSNSQITPSNPGLNDPTPIMGASSKAPQIPQLMGPQDAPQSKQASPFRSSKYSSNNQDPENDFSLPTTQSGVAPPQTVPNDTLRYPLGNSLGSEGQSELNPPVPMQSPDVGNGVNESAGQFSPASPTLIAGGNQNTQSENYPNNINVGPTGVEQSATPAFFQPRQSPVGAHSMFGVVPNYRPDLGHRNYAATVRNPGSWDNGEKFDFEEKKKEYPPMSEILATGRYFGSLSMLYLRPAFQNNTAITTNSATFSQSTPFDFDYEVAPQFRFGFESKYGPGFEMKYMQYDETSNVSSFTSNGIVSGETSTWMMGPSRWTRLEAANAGDVLQTTHSIDVESFSMMVFKELKFPISRINGSFGMQYVSIAQSLNATVTNGGALVGTLNSQSDMRAYGPRFMFEYYRPVGHTKLEFVTSVSGSVLFGRRDQFVQNSGTNDFNRIGADEFLTTTEFYSGAQYKKNFAENRSVFARIGFQYQAWHGGGTAVDAQDDFGLRGFAFGVGYNR